MQKRMLKALALALVSLLASFATSSNAQTNQAKNDPQAARLLALLDKSGYSYTKINGSVWEVPATGTNIKEFPIRIALSEDIVLLIVKLADRKEINSKDARISKLLEMNHDYDVVKFALSEDMLYARTDIHARLLDVEELKYLIEVMAHVVDQAYPQLKPLMSGAK